MTTHTAPAVRPLRRGLTAAALTVAAALTLSACGSNNATDKATDTASANSTGVSQDDLGGAAMSKDLTALYDQAVAAGQTSVVIYGPSGGSDQNLYDAFHEAFPAITVQGVSVVGPPLEQKLTAEETSNQHVGDIVYTGPGSMMKWADQGRFEPYVPIPIQQGQKPISDQVIGPKDSFYGVSTAIQGTIINTDLVTTKPTGWLDFVAPEWKGQVAMGDPTAQGGAADIFARLKKDPQDRYANLMQQYRDNDLQRFPSSQPTGPLDAVAQGAKKVGLGMGYNYYTNAKAKGAPIDFVLFPEDNYAVILYQGQIKGAPHPLAAQLYESWMMTPHGAKALARGGSYSTIEGSPAPDGMPPFASVELMWEMPLADTVELDNASVKAAQAIWGS